MVGLQTEGYEADIVRVDWQRNLFAVPLRSHRGASRASASGARGEPCGWLPGRLGQGLVIEEALRLSIWPSSREYQAKNRLTMFLTFRLDGVEIFRSDRDGVRK